MVRLEQGTINIDLEQLDIIQKEFNENHAFIIPNFLDLSLQKIINLKLSQAKYIPYNHNHYNKEVKAFEYRLSSTNFLHIMLNVMLNNLKVIDAFKSIIKVSDIQGTTGRIYKFEENENCYMDWHNDISKISNRHLGFSINLSKKPFNGGVFKIRNKQTKKIYREIKHNNWGDAHFFDINGNLEHIVERVRGNEPRIAFSGWFTDKTATLGKSNS